MAILTAHIWLLRCKHRKCRKRKTIRFKLFPGDDSFGIMKILAKKIKWQVGEEIGNSRGQDFCPSHHPRKRK